MKSLIQKLTNQIKAEGFVLLSASCRNLHTGWFDHDTQKLFFQKIKRNGYSYIVTANQLSEKDLKVIWNDIK